MTPASPYMLEILRRIDTAARKEPPPDRWLEAWQYPLATVKSLATRGLVERTDAKTLSTGDVYKTIGGFVRLTKAGRELLDPPVDTERLPDWAQEPVRELDDLPVLGTVTAAWPLVGR